MIAPLVSTTVATVADTNMLSSTASALRPTIEAFAKNSPTDSELAGLGDVELAMAAIRCATLDGKSYCLHHGWVDGGLSSDDVQKMINQQREQLGKPETGEESVINGDIPLAAQIRMWADQPRSQRVAAELAELEDALQALGKVKLWDHIFAESSVPQEFWKKYPETESWGKKIAENAERSANSTNDSGSVGDPNRGQKQKNGYYCGPTSFLAMAWTDPDRGDSLSPAKGYTQDHWARQLGTTKDGTAISSISKNMNKHLTGYVRNAGTYMVISHRDWKDNVWSSLAQNQLRFGPAQLHPVLKPGNNRYNIKTDGHFNVARSFNFNGNHKVIGIWEPAGAANGVPVAFEDSIGNIMAQNRAHPMKNIVY